MRKFKVLSLLIFIIFLWIVPVNAATYLGEFAVGESFVDEFVSYYDGSTAKISVIFKGFSTNVILLYIASLPETPYVIAPGYCLIDKKSNEVMWTFLIGFGVAGDRIYQLQKNSYNQVKVWRIQ